MKTSAKQVRQSVSLPIPIARRVKALAKTKKTSENRVIVGLIEVGLEAQEAEKRRFMELAHRLSQSASAAERERLKEELAGIAFRDMPVVQSLRGTLKKADVQEYRDYLTEKYR